MKLALVYGLVTCVVGMVGQWPTRATLRLALEDAIAAARMTQQDIYTALGYTQSQWSKIMRGEQRLPNLDRLENLPPAVWDEFLPRVAYVVWQRRQQEQQKRSA